MREAIQIFAEIDFFIRPNLAIFAARRNFERMNDLLMVFIKGLIVGLGASIPLGPVGVLCIQKTLSKGRMAGFISGLGASVSDTFYSAFSLMGLFFIEEFVANNKAPVLLIGGLVIALIGVRIYRSNPLKQIHQKKSKKRSFGDFFESFAMTITNPGSIFLIFGMFAAVRLDLSNYTGSGAGHAVRLVLTGIFLGSALWWFSLSNIVNIFRKKFRLKQLIILNRISGIIIIALGVISFCEGLLEALQIWR